MRNILWASLLSALFLLAPVAMARDLDRYSDMNWNTTGNTATGSSAAGAGPTSYGNSPGGPYASGKKPLPWPGKSQAENMAKWKMMASPRALTRSFMSPAAAIPMFAGMAFKWMMDQACVRLAGGTMELAPGAQWEECNMVTQQGLEWRASAAYHTTAWTTSKPQACFAMLEWHKANGAQTCTVNGVSQPVGRSIIGDVNTLCKIEQSCGGVGGTTVYDASYSSRSAIVTTQDGWKPTTSAAAEDKIASKFDAECTSDMGFGEPYSGRCTQALKDFIASGNSVPATELPLSGPATHTAPPVVKTETSIKTTPATSTNPATTTTITTITTTTETYKYTYNNQTVTTTKTTDTTTTVKGPDGAPISEETTKSEEEPDTAPATDTVLADVPKLYTPKYPDGLAGVWNTQIALIKATPLFTLPSRLAPDIGSSGGCPAWSVPINVGLASFGVQDASIPCNVWAFLRICVMVGALFLARALIFGG